MAITLGAHQYGKSATRLVHVGRDGQEHQLVDMTVDVTLTGDFADTYLTGDNSRVLPTDSQKNAVYAFARRYGVAVIEDFAALLARHFVDSQQSVHAARVSITAYHWRRLGPHSFQRCGDETRRAIVTYDGSQTWVVSGLTDLVLLNSTGSEFHGFIKDPYTTLAETTDRILATVVNAYWRYRTGDGDWNASYQATRQALIDAFVQTHSLSLQQTLYAMAERVLAQCAEVVEVRLALPNRHHLLVDLSPFGLDNPNVVFNATEQPYGLIEGTVLRDDAPPAGRAWALSA